MNRRSLMSLALLSLATFSLSSHAYTLEQLRDRLSGIETLSADFLQYRKLEGIPKPLISSGKVVSVKGVGLTWDQLSPFVQKMTIAKSGITVEVEGAEPRRVQAGDYQEAAFADVIEGMMSGDVDLLKKHFIVLGLKGSKTGPWTMKLLPGNGPFARIFRSVTVSGDDYVKTLTMISSARDQTSIAFSNIRTNGEINEGIRLRLGL